MLYCSNPSCQSPNQESHRFCQKCRTPLVRRYLWAVGPSSSVSPGDLLADRYLCKQSQIFLDTRPGNLPQTFSEVPEPLTIYLRLFPWRLHVPQLFDWVRLPSGDLLALLDQAPIVAADLLIDRGIQLADADPPEIICLPSLGSVWAAGSALKQLSWLWQIAHLWDAFSRERVAANLLDLERLRVEGALVRLLSVESSGSERVPQLSDLGQCWQGLASSASPDVAMLLSKLCPALEQGEVYNAEQLIDRLDEALGALPTSDLPQLRVATASDQGPTRSRNEDACYPASGTVESPAATSMVIVCDGIGGHQGGDVASHLAIEVVQERVSSLPLEVSDPTTISVGLEKAICAANDAISQRNDSEQRFDRQRMGTTIVMAVLQPQELHLAHVGDSRAYRITRWGCHQVTLDDDVASREVRLGYSSYAQALQQPSSGSLVQALGMAASTMLYPTVQRLLFDEDSVLLLCSDGLSDHDRVEEVWEAEILPLLDGKAEVGSVAQRLIEIANTLNGHDNVTIGLIHCSFGSEPQSLPPIEPVVAATKRVISETAPELASYDSDDADAELETTKPIEPPTGLKTTVVAPIATKSAPAKATLLPLLIGIAALAGLGGLLLAFGMSLFDRSPDPVVANSPTLSPSASPVPSVPSPTALQIGTLVQLRRSIDLAPPVLLSAPQLGPEPVAVQGSVPPGSLLKVLGKQSDSARNLWVQMQVCPIGNSASPAASPEAAVAPPELVPSVSPSVPPAALVLQPGQTGWIREADLQPQIVTQSASTAAACPLPSG